MLAGLRPARSAGSKAGRPTRSGRLPRCGTGSGSSPAAIPRTTTANPSGVPPTSASSRPVSSRRDMPPTTAWASCSAARSSPRSSPSAPARAATAWSADRTAAPSRRARDARPRLKPEPTATVRVPPRDRPDRVRTFDGGPLAPARLDRLVPARRNESRREIGQRREHEQPLPGVPMRDLEQPRRLRRIGLGLDRAGLGRAVDREPGSAEDEQVEVELARTPAPPTPAPEVALEALQRREERRSHRSPGPGRPERRAPRPRCENRADR